MYRRLTPPPPPHARKQATHGKKNKSSTKKKVRQKLGDPHILLKEEEKNDHQLVKLLFKVPTRTRPWCIPGRDASPRPKIHLSGDEKKSGWKSNQCKPSMCGISTVSPSSITVQRRNGRVDDATHSTLSPPPPTQLIQDPTNIGDLSDTYYKVSPSCSEVKSSRLIPTSAFYLTTGREGQMPGCCIANIGREVI